MFQEKILNNVLVQNNPFAISMVYLCYCRERVVSPTPHVDVSPNCNM